MDSIRVSNIVDEYESEFIDKIKKLASRVFLNEILPYLKENKISFASGNGTYMFYKNNPNNRAFGYDDVTDDMPKDIIELVQIPVFIRGNEELGLWMESHEV